MHLPKGTLLQNGKYKIVRFIKSGGFGCTYEGEQTLMGERVAIKELFVNDICNREDDNTVSVGTKSKVDDFMKLKRSFIREATVLFRMKNPHIVRVTDVFEENGTAYYVMDYIDGPSLADMVARKGKLSEKETLNYIQQVCQALKYVHAQNRMHMDIKPGNIMVDKNGDAILIDFGTSKYYDEQTGEQTSTLMGIYTKGYAPIEQIDRTFNKFSPPTDIYALGATAYKLLTGITPPDSISRLTQSAELKPLPSNISPSLCWAIESAMQIFSKNRPQTVEQLEEMLNRQLNGTQNTKNELTRFDEGTIIEKRNTQSRPNIPNSLSVEKSTPISDNIINGQEFVDLGLPSGLLWATCNVGASKPEEYGDYFAWGEIEPKQKYKERNCETSNTGTWFNKIGFNSNTRWLRENDYIDHKGNLTLSHDAAYQKWGATWRMPTKKEFEELINCTTSVWINREGIRGCLIKSNINGNSIFLPAAGYRYGSSLKNTDSCGSYRSSSPSGSNPYQACSLYLSADKLELSWNHRFYGRTIRPVSDRSNCPVSE